MRWWPEVKWNKFVCSMTFLSLLLNTSRCPSCESTVVEAIIALRPGGRVRPWPPQRDAGGPVCKGLLSLSQLWPSWIWPAKICQECTWPILFSSLLSLTFAILFQPPLSPFLLPAVWCCFGSTHSLPTVPPQSFCCSKYKYYFYTLKSLLFSNKLFHK